MRISDTITIRRGRAYEIKGTSEDGTMLLRPTKMVEMPKSVALPAPKKDVEAEAPAPISGINVTMLENGLNVINFSDVDSWLNSDESIVTPVHRPADPSTRYGSCAKRGMRKGAQVRHYYDCRLYAFDRPGKCWKNTRHTQYRLH